MAGQEVDAYTRSQSDAKFELKGTAYSKIESDAKYLKKVDKIDAYSKIECNATFLKKTEKIDSYSKTESDDKFALKTSLPELATETKAGIVKLKNSITAEQEDTAVTEKAVSKALKAQLLLGVGQAWQDLTSTRKRGVTYTNTTGRPILISVALSGRSDPSTSIYVNGVRVSFSTSSGTTVCHSLIIPNNHTYKVGNDGTDIVLWSELR